VVILDLEDVSMRPIIFLNTTWMERYEGLIGDDVIVHGGGSYVDEYGYGHEIFNFKKIRGKVFGFAQQKGQNKLERLGADPSDDFLDDVLVIFTAKHKDGGTYIVGWYKNARFYRSFQEKTMAERIFKNEYIGYCTETIAENATLLSTDERFLFPVIPRGVKGGMGQSNFWYADSELGIKFKIRILQKIEKYEKIKVNISKKRAVARANNIETKKKVEKIAVGIVTNEFIERDFEVRSVESENLGWDLEAIHKKTELKIEVKGLSGNSLSVEVSSNEYEKMYRYKDSYRLCVVINCLTNPILYTFAYSNEKKCWLNEEGNELIIEEIISARCKI
jgi:hypothetical protein